MHSRWFHGACVSTVIFASACTTDSGYGVKDNDETELGVDYESLDQDLTEAEAFDDVTADDESDDEAPADIADNNDDLSSAEGPQQEPSQELHPGGGGAHPTIHAVFTLFDNATVDDTTHERTVSKHYPNFHKRGSWEVTNVLNGGYRIWNYRKGGGHWWNGPVHDQRRWIYDDTNRHDHPGEADQLQGTIEERSDNGPGIIFMAFSEDFQSFLGLKSLKRKAKGDLNGLDVKYSYEVYSGNDGKSPYHHWFKHFGLSSNKFPIFDISAWSSSDKCNKDEHPSRPLTRNQIRFSTIYRARHRVASDLYVGLYSGCFIHDADMQRVINWLDATQVIINNDR